MRVVAGKFKGRPLKSLPGNNTRPTTDKVKGAIFNMIGPYFSGGVALDLYGGSGSLGIEAVSRGCTQAVIADMNQGAIKIIKENVSLTKEGEHFLVWKTRDKQTLKKAAENNLQFSLVFLDPPYAKQKIQEIISLLLELDLLLPGAWVVCETDKGVTLDDIPQLTYYKEQTYGISKVTLYQKGE